MQISTIATIDGNEAVARVAYRLNEVIALFEAGLRYGSGTIASTDESVIVDEIYWESIRTPE